jgi:hypothetical protein
MYHLKITIAEFLQNSRRLIFGVNGDAFVKERILPYNFDEARITVCVDTYNKAEKAESVKSQEFGEQLGARIIFEKTLEEANSLFYKHTDFLKLALRDDLNMQKELFLVGIPRSRRISDWLKHMREVYERVLEHEEVIPLVGRYGLTREDLEAGYQKVLDAILAKDKHSAEQDEAEDATFLRDEAFEELIDVVEELETVCIYALEDRPQLLEKFGIPVMAPKYKRTSSTQPEEPTQSTT